MNINEIFAKNLVVLRSENDVTQSELASALGVSPQAVSKWERAICCPDISLLPAIADIFGVEIGALLK